MQSSKVLENMMLPDPNRILNYSINNILQKRALERDRRDNMIDLRALTSQLNFAKREGG